MPNYPATDTLQFEKKAFVNVSSSAPDLRTGVSLAELYDLDSLRERNITGKGVKIAVFDSGLADAYITKADQGRGRNLNVRAEVPSLSKIFNDKRKLKGFSFGNWGSEEFLKEPEESPLYEDEEEVGWAHPVVEQSPAPD